MASNPHAENHVPSDIPPNGLPQAALDHMSETALEQITADHDSLIFPRQFSQAGDHVPSDSPPNGLPQAGGEYYGLGAGTGISGFSRKPWRWR